MQELGHTDFSKHTKHELSQVTTSRLERLTLEITTKAAFIASRIIGGYAETLRQMTCNKVSETQTAPASTTIETTNVDTTNYYQLATQPDPCMETVTLKTRNH